MMPAAKRYSTIPQNHTLNPFTTSTNPLKTSSFKPNFEGSSVLSGVSFNASFMDAAKKTKLNSTSALPYEHKKVLNLGDNGGPGQKRNVPSEILNDFRLPVGK